MLENVGKEIVYRDPVCNTSTIRPKKKLKNTCRSPEEGKGAIEFDTLAVHYYYNDGSSTKSRIPARLSAKPPEPRMRAIQQEGNLSVAR